MTRSRLARICFMLLALSASFLPTTASACSVCMGDPNSKAAGAINGALFLMLGFVGFILSALAAFAWVLMKRAGNPVAPHAEIAAMMSAPDTEK